MKHLLFVITFSILAATCFASDAKSAIAAATKSYVAGSSGISQVKVTVEKVDGDYARAKVAPSDGTQTDAAWVFLKNKKGTWTGLTMGTFFEPQDYKIHGIPASLWVK